MKHLREDISENLGIEPVKVEELVLLLGIFGMLKKGAVERYERDATMYELRGKVSTSALACRFQVSGMQAFRIIKAHAAARRKMLREAV